MIVVRMSYTPQDFQGDYRHIESIPPMIQRHANARMIVHRARCRFRAPRDCFGAIL